MNGPELNRIIHEELNLTQVAFAEKIGYDRATVCRWCTGAMEVPKVVEQLIIAWQRLISIGVDCVNFFEVEAK